MRQSYLEMHGAGNRIVVIDRRSASTPAAAADALSALTAGGVKFDQLMWLEAAEDPAHAGRYRVFNVDGSEVEQCGNGARCLVRAISGRGGRQFVLESPAGLVEARLLDGDRVAVNMGSPVLEPVAIPFIADEQARRYTLDVAGEQFDVAVLSMGNPHCVLDVADVETAAVERLGPLIERHERFPARANVGFMQVIDRSHIALRVHERGAGETLACGTGACAAVVAGRRAGRLDDEVEVRLPGGQLVVSWRGAVGPVWLTGAAELIREGSIDL
jgi:diaminopimelate epimerase